DAFFLERSQKRAENFIDKANIIFLASHSEHLVRGICNKGILLDQGRVVAAGGIDELYEIYANIETRPGNRPFVSLAASVHPAQPDPDSGYPELKLFSSESAPHTPAVHAFDRSEITFWSSAIGQPVEARAHIGIQFPEPVAPQTALLRQRVVDLHNPNNVRSVAIEVSDDGFEQDIRRAAVVGLSRAPILHRIPLQPGLAGRWWRVIALSTFEPDLPAWAITRFDLIGDALPEFHAGHAVSSAPASRTVSSEHAFEDSSESPWVSIERADEVEETSWIGWDFGIVSRPTIYGIEIQQWNGGELPNTVGALYVECSEEAFDEHATALQRVTLEHTSDTQTFWLKAPRKARYWRVRAATGTNGGRWGVRRLKFLERPAPRTEAPEKSAS
ncbi:MAG: hypothetical protein JJ899_10965, partial [Alphaproteobacteria bacterium]|nr:hypothetical protein [Alphaproteobacteria bacterium]